LKTIRASEGISRADLSRHFGLSRSSVSSLTEQLCTLGVVEETHLAASSGGRPPRVLQLKPNSCMVVGVDLGSSHIAVLSMNLGGEIQAVSEMEMDCQNHPALALQKIVEIVSGLQTDKPIIGVGVAVPSPVIDGKLSERILPAWKGIHLQSTLEGMLGVRVFVGNDANLGALAERWWGNCQGVDDFVFVKMATGVGAGLVQNGKILLGAAGYAGELGHVPISNEGICRCGMTGCLEAHIGLPYLNARIENLEAASGATLLDMLSTITSDQMQRVLDETAQSLSVALSILVNLLNPHKIVLWGPIPQHIPNFLELLRKSMSFRNLWSPMLSECIEVSALGEQGVARGAATLLLEEAFSNPLLFADMQESSLHLTQP
jgi:predicted NBD/HSP70 family sugar kinase